MDILVNVANQKLKIATNLKSLVAGTQEFVRFVFNLTGDWDDLLTFAQFRQNGVAYNQYLDDEKSAYLPAEIGTGTCTLMLYGSNKKTIATTNYLILSIDENILVSDANSTEISESLYTQLVTKVNSLTTWNEQNSADLVAKDKELQEQVNKKANQIDLDAEITRAKKAETENSNAIKLKASQSEVDDLALKVTQLENNEVVANLITEAVQKELTQYLESGKLAEMTIKDKSISRKKVDANFETTLVKADNAMQPSVYDPQKLAIDVYSYAQAKADTVQKNLNDVKTELQDGYKLTDTLVYNKIGDAIRGAVSLSRTYAQALLADYKAFTIEIRDSLPVTGESLTFYLIPNKAHTGYDKYWWITDSEGNSKWDVFGSATTLVVTELPEVGDEDTDYILKSSSGCLYYKYIDGNWNVVAGSIADVVSKLPETGNEFTDYYVLNESGSYVHHRWINGSFREIGGNSYTKDELDAMIVKINDNISTANDNIARLGNKTDATDLNVSSLSKAVTSLQQELSNLDVEGYTYYATYNTDGLFQLIEVKDDVETVKSQFTIKGGGGGDIKPTTNLTVDRVTESPLIITTTDKAEIEILFSCTDADGEFIDANYVWKSGNNTVLSGALVQGTNKFDLSDYVTVGTQKFTLTVTDETGNMVVKAWTVQVVDVRLESTFSDRYTYPAGKTVNFTYTPYGSISKDVHIKLDGVEIASVSTSASGTLQSYTLPAQEHGAHLLECYVTAVVNNKTIETEHIYKDIIWFDENSDVPVIGCIYRHDHYGNVAAKQYNTTSIPYVVYDPNTDTPSVTLEIDGEVNSTLSLSQAYNTWAYKTEVVAIHTLVIKCKNTSVTIKLDVKELGIDINPVTGGLAFDFNPTGYSNSSENRLWKDKNTGVAMSVSDNFDWSNGGYQIDDEGNQYFCVKAGTSAVIDYNLFGRDASLYGAEFKAVFKVTNVQKIDATFLSCQADSTVVGLQMNAHEAYLKSSIDSLYVPYSEEDIIEFEYNINTINTEDSDATSIIMSYEDGVGARPMIYDSTHRLYQYAPVPITIGSPYCDVHIYRMKAYEAALSDSDILSNFIADSRDSDTMISRYDRNQIYNENNELTPESVAAACPDLRVIKIEAPYFTNDKKDFVKNTSMECIYKNGDPVLDNWKFTNCYHAGQGTTSNEYGYAGRNIDVICCFDGIHQATGKIKLDPNYITQLVLGDGTKYTDGKGKVSLTRNSVPNNWWNFKVNIASSENANNALLQKRFNDYLPYQSLGNKRDSKVKNSMEFVNCVIFIKENNPDVSTHREFADTNWHFYAIGNMGDSKKTDNSRAYDPTDMNEFCVEISDNTLDNSTFQTGVTDSKGKMVYPISTSQWKAGNKAYDALYNDWDGSFEFRYDCCGDSKDGVSTSSDEEKEAQRLKNKQVWREFYEWVITSSDENFVNEYNDWCVESSMLYLYLFTERYTMIDNRAKNTFWHFAKTGNFHAVKHPKTTMLHTYCELVGSEYVKTSDTSVSSGKTYYTEYAFDLWDYDNDTALGINNSGELTMSYGKEDIDYKTDGVPSSGYIFNAAESVFWCRTRDLMKSKLSTLYQSISANCWSANHLINEFDAWQEQFPEELWRLDIERKYYRTYQGGGLNGTPTTRFLSEMMNGRKKYQRRQWERDQEAYVGTKYLTSTVRADQIMFRCNTPTGSDIVVKPNYTLHIVPYSDMYLSVMFGNSSPTQVRAKAGIEYEIECPYTTMDDTAVLIYCASRIQELNDLSACYIHDNDFSKATKIRKLVIGNTTEGYGNSFLTTLNLGANKILEELDIRNCHNLTGSINLSNCGNLVKLYAEGTILTGVLFATNGKIAIAHLPATINSMTMKNLNYLTDLQVASYDNLESLTVENSIVDELSIVRIALKTLQTLRLIGINWTLSDTTLLNQILKMSNSMLSGSVYVSGQIRNQELLKYENAWGDLEVTYDPQNLVPQYLVTFVNSDGNKLYEMWVDRGAAPEDPVSAGYIQTPTLPSDAQYNYTFKGWDDITSVVLAARTVTAEYTTEVRKYTVTWYSRAGLSLGSKEAFYGDEVVYDGDLPTNTSEESSYVYNLFSGWDKSTGYITGDTDVYAVWKRAELPSPGMDLKDMNEAQLYAVIASGRTENYFETKDYIDINIGHDVSYSNVEEKVLLENTYFDGKKAIDSGIKLFDANERSFTLAIDFEFIGTNAGDTLVSCFEESGNEGFRLRYSAQPNIQWGDKSINVGYGQQKGIVVLRHVKGSNRLFIYAYNVPTGANIFDDSIGSYELVRVRNTNTDATLSFGAVKFSDGGYDYYGTGWINWCKIWYQDLGADVASRLAAWTHETWRAEYCDSGRYRLAGATSQKCSASFILNNELHHGHRMNATDTNVGGWDACLMRTFLNTRVYNALPLTWQSMLKTVKISASAGDKSTEIITSEDKIYLAANRELGGWTTEPYVNEGYAISWFTKNSIRCKFRGQIIPDDATYYTSNTDPTALSTASVKRGDIWINTGNQEIGYYYIPADEKNKHYFYGGNDNIVASDGGLWLRAQYWWERSPNAGNSTYFVLVHGNGSPYNGSFAATTYAVVPCFSI